MSDHRDILAVLQHGDSFFPSGAASFSWGIETLSGEGAVADADQLSEFIEGQILCRWATFDWPATVAAYRAADDPDAVAGIDQRVDCQTLSLEMREGSRKSGLSLLMVHQRLGTRGADGYKRRVMAGETPGHSPVVQGMLWSHVGVPAAMIGPLSAHGLCTALLGAALRLGIIGHVDAQRILSRSGPVIAGVLEQEPPSIDRIGAFAPQAEIAMMRHEISDSRLFAN